MVVRSRQYDSKLKCPLRFEIAIRERGEISLELLSNNLGLSTLNEIVSSRFQSRRYKLNFPAFIIERRETIAPNCGLQCVEIDRLVVAVTRDSTTEVQEIAGFQ